MLFNSYAFLFAFLPISLAGYFWIGRLGRPAAGGWLVFISLVFYGWWNPTFVVLLAISITFNYGTSLVIGRTTTRPKLKLWVLVLGIAANLAALIYYKYLAWLVGLLNSASVTHFAVPSIVLPLGISFFTFTQIGYLVDCAAGVAKDRNPLNYMLFVTFFPHLIAGPILHNQEIMPQFADGSTYRPSSTNLAVGSGIFFLGLVKKCLLADPASVYVVGAFSHPSGVSFVLAWQAALLFSLQLYFDFSGYSDMAIGLARMFNVRFPLNFDSPYKSASVIEFWQRWHMTLTRFLTRYIYSPLAVWVMRRRRKQGRPITGAAYTTLHGFSTMIAFPVATTMALAGIWHGSGAQFLVFGLLHAFYLCVNHAWRIFGPKPRGGPPRFMAHAGNVLLTYLCVLVASIFFRAPSVGGALSLIGGMLGLHGWALALIVPHALLAGHSSGLGALLQSNGLIRAGSWNEAASVALEIAWLAALFLIVWMMPNTEQVFADYAPALQPLRPPSSRWLRWRVSLPWAIALGCTATLAILSVGGTSEFLYFQF